MLTSSFVWENPYEHRFEDAVFSENAGKRSNMEKRCALLGNQDNFFHTG